MDREYGQKSLEALRHIASYNEEFGASKKQTSKMWMQVIEEGEKVFERSNMRGHITTSMMVLDKSLQSCLLVDHIHHKLWLAPGGHVEDGSLIENAIREVIEETGIQTIKPLQETPVHIDTHPITARPAKKEGEHFHHDILFVGVTDYVVDTSQGTVGLGEDDALAHQEEEVADAKWFNLREVAQKTGHAAEGAQNIIRLMERGKIKADLS